MTLLALLACDGPVRLGPAAECGPGRITVASKLGVYDTLADAIADAAADDVVCLGEGTFPVSHDPCELDVGDDTARRLRVEGQGAEATVLVGGGGGCRDVALDFGEGSSIGIGGVTFEDARIRVDAEEVVLRDVLSRGATGDGWRVLDVDAWRFVIDDVTLAESRLDYGGGFRFDGDGELTDFDVRDVVYEEGYLGELDGDIVWRGGEVAGNQRIVDYPGGYDLVETWGDVTVEDVTFTGNRTNGPLLTAYGTLTGVGLVITGNEATGLSVIEADAQVGEGALRLVGTEISGNVGGTGAVGLYGGTIALDGVTFAGNTPCDVVVEGACAEVEVGEDATLSCDDGGCR